MTLYLGYSLFFIILAYSIKFKYFFCRNISLYEISVYFSDHFVKSIDFDFFYDILTAETNERMSEL